MRYQKEAITYEFPGPQLRKEPIYFKIAPTS